MADCSYIDPVQRGGARWAAELEIVSGQDKTMSPMTLIASNLSTGITILPNHNDEEFGEEIVDLFIAHTNYLRHAQRQSDHCTVVDMTQIPAGGTEVCLERLNNFRRSLGPNDDPMILWGITEAQDRLLHAQKEQVNTLRELASYKEMEPKLWI
jgi:hypothetical protein